MSYKLSSTCLKCSLLGAFLLILQSASAQDDWSDLDAALSSRQKLLGNNLVMMVWKNDTIAYKKELGEFNSKTQAPIASASKWLTAALVMVLVDEGKLSLDDKVSQYLPEFERYGKNYVTLRLAMSHHTGIADEGKGLKKMFQRKKFSSLEDEVNSYAAREIRTNPGQDFWYGDLGINIAGRVCEVVMKKKFDVLIKQKLFTPLTMRRTTFTTVDLSAVSPADGALSTADDYMQFLVMLLNKGKYKGKQIISEESVEELLKISTKPELMKYVPKGTEGYNYALGSWVVNEKDGKATAWVNPGVPGAWPVIDYCRGYVYLVLAKSPLSEDRPEIHKQLKEVVDAHSTATCP